MPFRARTCSSSSTRRPRRSRRERVISVFRRSPGSVRVTWRPERRLSARRLSRPIPIPPRRDATDQHLRGSVLLLFGRVVALGLNFLIQILIVRYLSKSDYGAFAYA